MVLSNFLIYYKSFCDIYIDTETPRFLEDTDDIVSFL